jgi:hypothetical protein
MVEAGVSPEAVESARVAIADGARASGRSIDELELWWYVKAAIAESYDDALVQALGPLAASGALVLGRDPAGRLVPPRLHDAVRELARSYRMRLHLRTDQDDPNRALLADGELRAYLLDRFGLVGSDADWRERISQLRARGIERIFCAAVVPDLDSFIGAVAGRVLPARVRGTAAHSGARR